MQLFKVNENGEMINIDKLEFLNDNIYIVDDQIIVYIWVGVNASQKKKDITAEFARKYEKERGETKIRIMRQDREYGSFLAMMDDLKKGLLPGITIERRPELKLEKPQKIDKSGKELISLKNKKVNIETNLIEWLEQLKRYRKIQPEEKAIDQEELELEHQIREAAYYLSLENYSYDDLCWMLAEKILKYTLRMPSIEDIKKKAEDVFISSCTYDELCWLNAEMDLLIKKEYIKKEVHNFTFN
ncbi:MAG: hypothetical protein EU532_08555 [Promethearchaeota archaeon]|nr:MAG: hypothetical protein EU532_08555 [Candidatus Lokiarchaeota archaeon]